MLIKIKKMCWICESALPCFKTFLEDDMVNFICEETNLYNAPCNMQKGAIGTRKEEIEKYLGIVMMSVIKAPYYQCYWEMYTRYKPIASQMSCDRFESIKRFLHFNNSLKNKKRVDKIRNWLFKICLIFEKLLQNCQVVDPEEHNSIDE